ncbi:MAG: hypothetical protein HQK52_21770 [Oligoflexia bacterium]|nr:hypothetical protein [Oligoflexia bacterium]
MISVIQNDFSKMYHLLLADIQEKELLKTYPKLRPLVKKPICQKILLTIAAKDNDFNFLKYVLHKYKLQLKVLLLGKKYFSQFKIDTQKQMMEIFSITPENKKGQKQTLHLPRVMASIAFFLKCPSVLKLPNF